MIRTKESRSSYRISSDPRTDATTCLPAFNYEPRLSFGSTIWCVTYDGRCALKIIASQIRKSCAHTPSRTSHMPLAHRIHLLFIAQKPRFALGGVFRLGLDRARSRRSTVMIFIPTTVREGVLFFVRSKLGTTTLISWKFEIVFTHGPSMV